MWHTYGLIKLKCTSFFCSVYLWVVDFLPIFFFHFYQNTLLMCGYVYLFIFFLWYSTNIQHSILEAKKIAWPSTGGERGMNIHSYLCANHSFIVTPQVFAPTFYYARMCGHCVLVTERKKSAMWIAKINKLTDAKRIRVSVNAMEIYGEKAMSMSVHIHI